MLFMTELCQELRNWFDRYEDKFAGDFVISDGVISGEISLKENQYYRIIGSTFNDGVHVYNDSDSLVDEQFKGVVWAMAIPPAVVALADEIEQWIALYGGVDSVNMSPYNSESFGGYSYSKSGGGSSTGTAGGNAGTWQAAFASRLNKWRKI